MKNIRLSRSLCAVVGEALQGSHATLDALFRSSGAPGDPPDLSHHAKWKEWLFRVGQDEKVDSLDVLGNVLEEIIDIPPLDDELNEEWQKKRQRVIDVLEDNGLRYYRGGRILPSGEDVQAENFNSDSSKEVCKPKSIDELLNVLVMGLPRAMYPLQHRRKNSEHLSFSSEYDIQDLLHALLRPWVFDVRPEEFTPSYAGSNTRMDFLLPDHSLVIETKLIRDKAHGKKVGDELIIDIDHYRVHPKCLSLLCVIYDPNNFIQNVGGLTHDLEGKSENEKGTVITKVIVI